MRTDDTDSPDEVRPAEVEFSLHWRADGGSGLTGELVARNVSDRTWRISGKPALVLVDAEGHDLVDVGHVVTLEFRMPGYAVVPPGGTARAPVQASPPTGTALAERVGIEWGTGHRDDVPCTWPAGPAADADPQTSSSWFMADA